MEDMRAALAAKGYDLVGAADGSDSEDDIMSAVSGRIPSLEPNVAREKGKAAFEKGKYDKAIKYWQGGLKSILSALCSGPEAMSNTSLSELDLTLNLNIAMAYMKKGDFEAADRSVDKALARRDALPTHQITKALYRKASAQRSMRKLDETLETLKDLLEVDPTNAAALKMHQEVDREWKKQTKVQTQGFKSMFTKMQAEDKKEGERMRRDRNEARRKSGVQWAAEDVDSEGFERGEAPGCDGRDWGMALSRSVLWSIEQLAVEGGVFLPPDLTHASAWFLGSSSTCEMRWLQPAALMSRLPGLSTLELVLIGFEGEKDPENKIIPDARANTLPKAVLKHPISDSRRCYVRTVKGYLQDALKGDLMCVDDALKAATEASEASAAAKTEASSEAAAVSSREAPAASSDAPAPGGESEPAAASASQESPAEEVPSGIVDSFGAPVPDPAPPSVCFIVTPQLHRYFSDFYPAITWLIKNNVPTILMGGSEPDLSWKQDEILLKALGANIVVSKRESPYPMCLPDDSRVKKCNHIIGFVGGKALEREKLVKTKIDLLSQDYTVM